MSVFLCLCDAGLQSQQQQASQQTNGIAPLVHSAVLTDRRHILTKDAEGMVELWDIATGAVEERYGKVPSLPVLHHYLLASHSESCNVTLDGLTDWHVKLLSQWPEVEQMVLLTLLCSWLTHVNKLTPI